jgi:hypothetical protein
VALSRDDTTVIILLIGEASGVFAGFCPSWFTVSSEFFNEGNAREGNIRRIREGEVAATAIVVATGAAVAIRGGQPVALWASVLISAVFIAGYERAIRKPAATVEHDGGAGGPASHTLAARSFG